MILVGLGINTVCRKYDARYKRFIPVKFNADKWICIAQLAGMKYIIFIAKHHDGFCNWDTKTTEYSIMHTPLNCDICKELAAAAPVLPDIPLIPYSKLERSIVGICNPNFYILSRKLPAILLG